MALTVTAVGALNLAATIVRGIAPVARVVDRHLGLDLGGLGFGAGAVASLTLLLLGRQLARRKRLAWMVAVVAAGTSAAAHGFARELVPTMLSVALTVALAATSDAFRARPDPASRHRLAPIPLLLAAEIVLGTILLSVHLLRRGHAAPLGTVLRDVLGQMVGLAPSLPVTDRFADWSGAMLLGFTALAVGWTIWLLFRPVIDRTPRPDEDSLRKLVSVSGGTLDYFLLRDDKTVVLSPDGRAALGYRSMSGVGVGAGDPVGDEDAAAAVIRAFVGRCAAHGWRPAIVGIHERFRDAWEQAGLRDIALGDEAVVDVHSLELSGQRRKSLRQAVNRIDRSYAFDLTRVADLSAPERAELRELSRMWRGTQPERGFTMALGRIADPRDPDVRVARARGREDGELAAFLQLVPCRGGLSLDVMRRVRDAPNGLHDFLIVRSVQTLAAEGGQRLSLNFAGFRALLRSEVPLNPVQRLMAAGLRWAGRYFPLESLLAFNEKFDPRWEPRRLVYAEPEDLAAVALAAAQAEAFVPRPPRHRRPAST